MKKKELKPKKQPKKPVKQKQKQSQNVKINLSTSGPSGFQGPSNNTLYIPAPVHHAPINIHIPNQFNNKEGENLPIKNLVETIPNLVGPITPTGIHNLEEEEPEQSRKRARNNLPVVDRIVPENMRKRSNEDNIAEKERLHEEAIVEKERIKDEVYQTYQELAREKNKIPKDKETFKTAKSIISATNKLRK